MGSHPTQAAASGPFTSVRISEFGDEILRIYEPPRSKEGTFRRMARAISALVTTPGIETTADLSVEAIDRFVAAWGATGPVMDPMVRIQYRLLCRIAVKLGHLDRDPFEGRPWPKVGRPAVPSREDIEKVLARLRDDVDSLPGHRLLAMAATAADAGLRVAEMVSLRRADVDLKGRILRIPSRERQPGFDPPSVDLSPRLAEILASWMGRLDSAWLFPDSSGLGPTDEKTARRGHRLLRLEAIGESLGLRDISFKGFRRAWEVSSAPSKARAPLPSGNRRAKCPGPGDRGPRAPMPIAEFAREVLKRYAAPGRSKHTYNTMKARLKTLVAMDGVTTTADLTDSLAERIMGSISNRTYRIKQSHIKSYKTIFRLSNAMGVAPPTSFVHRDRSEAGKNRKLTADDIARVLSHLESAADTPDARRLHVMAAMAAYTGMTRDQILSLHVSDCDIRAGMIRIPCRSARGLHRRYTVVPIEPALARILGQWLTTTGSTKAFPCDDENGQWSIRSRDKLKERLRIAGIAAGIPGVTFRSLRLHFYQAPLKGERRTSPKPGEPVRLYGKLKAPLTEAQHGALSALISGGPDGLTRAEMNAVCAFSGWRQIFIAMRRADPDWNTAIRAPEGRHRGRWRFDLDALEI